MTKKEKFTVQSAKLVGTWKLVSLESRSSSGKVTYPYGRDPFGMLMFDSGGNMSVLLMRRDRPKFTSSDMMKGTAEEVKTAFEGFAAYCGKYEVDEKKGTFTSHVEGSWFPNWVGTDQLRLFKRSGDQLQATTPLIQVGGEQLTLRFIWKRVSK